MYAMIREFPTKINTEEYLILFMQISFSLKTRLRYHSYYVVNVLKQKEVIQYFIKIMSEGNVYSFS